MKVLHTRVESKMSSLHTLLEADSSLLPALLVARNCPSRRVEDAAASAGRHEADKTNGLRAHSFKAAGRVKWYILSREAVTDSIHRRARMQTVSWAGREPCRTLRADMRTMFYDTLSRHASGILSGLLVEPVPSVMRAMHQPSAGSSEDRLPTHSLLATSLSCVSGRLMPSRPHGM
jgi:hypothetical protein